MNKISIASRRKKHQASLKSSGKKIAMIPKRLQMEIGQSASNAQTETEFEFPKEELAKLFSNINKALSQQNQIQFSITLTQTNTNKIEINVNSQPNGDSNVGRLYSTILTSDEVCDILKIKRSFLHKYTRMGVIPGLKIGRKWRFEADSIFELFRET